MSLIYVSLLFAYNVNRFSHFTVCMAIRVDSDELASEDYIMSS